MSLGSGEGTVSFHRPLFLLGIIFIFLGIFFFFLGIFCFFLETFFGIFFLFFGIFSSPLESPLSGLEYSPFSSAALFLRSFLLSDRLTFPAAHELSCGCFQDRELQEFFGGVCVGCCSCPSLVLLLLAHKNNVWGPSCSEGELQTSP